MYMKKKEQKLVSNMILKYIGSNAEISQHTTIKCRQVDRGGGQAVPLTRKGEEVLSMTTSMMVPSAAYVMHKTLNSLNDSSTIRQVSIAYKRQIRQRPCNHVQFVEQYLSQMILTSFEKLRDPLLVLYHQGADSITLELWRKNSASIPDLGKSVRA